MRIVIDNNLVSYLAGIESYEVENHKNNLLTPLGENLKSLIHICLSHNKNIIDLYIPSTVKGEMYNGKLTGDIKQLKEVFIAMMLKGVDAFIYQEQFNSNYQKFKLEFGKFFNFDKKNDERDFRIVVEGILFEVNILITCDNPLVKKGSNKEINRYIKIFTPQQAEYYLLNKYKPYREFASKFSAS